MEKSLSSKKLLKVAKAIASVSSLMVSKVDTAHLSPSKGTAIQQQSTKKLPHSPTPSVSVLNSRNDSVAAPQAQTQQKPRKTSQSVNEKLALQGQTLNTPAPKKKKRKLKKTKLKKVLKDGLEISYDGPNLIEQFNNGLLSQTADVRTMPTILEKTTSKKSRKGMMTRDTSPQPFPVPGTASSAATLPQIVELQVHQTPQAKKIRPRRPQFTDMGKPPIPPPLVGHISQWLQTPNSKEKMQMFHETIFESIHHQKPPQHSNGSRMQLLGSRNSIHFNEQEHEQKMLLQMKLNDLRKKQIAQLSDINVGESRNALDIPSLKKGANPSMIIKTTALDLSKQEKAERALNASASELPSGAGTAMLLDHLVNKMEVKHLKNFIENEDQTTAVSSNQHDLGSLITSKALQRGIARKFGSRSRVKLSFSVKKSNGESRLPKIGRIKELQDQIDIIEIKKKAQEETQLRKEVDTDSDDEDEDMEEEPPSSDSEGDDSDDYENASQYSSGMKQDRVDPSEQAVWEDKNLVEHEYKIKKFLKNYHRCGNEDLKDPSSPPKDPMAGYLRYVNRNRVPPHRIQFTKNPHIFEKNEEGDSAKHQNAFGLKSFHINAGFADAFSNNLKHNSHLTQLVLKRTNLTDITFTLLHRNLPKNLTRIDISGNSNLSYKSYSQFCNNLLEKRLKLTHINLDGNECGDKVIEELCQVLQALGTLLVINFSKCNLTCPGAIAIANLVADEETKIKSLILHWNRIRGKGSGALAKAIKYNHTIQVFDASFNSFGSCKLAKKLFKHKVIQDQNFEILMPEQQAELLKLQHEEQKANLLEEYTNSAHKWSQTLRKNRSLIHLDLSFNHYNIPDMQIIGEGLKRNHSILGIHFMGNDCKVDELGFIQPEKVWNAAEYHVFTRIPYHLKAGTVKREKRAALNVCSNCWICEGWTCVRFTIHKSKVDHALSKNFGLLNPNTSHYQEDPAPLVNIHLNFDHYTPHIMVESKEIYMTYLMVPPGSLNYFYTVRDANISSMDPRNKLKTMVDNNNPAFFTDMMTLQIGHSHVNVPKLNYLDGDVEAFAQTLTPVDLIDWKAPPRPRSREDTADNWYDEDDEERKRREAAKIWSVQNSIFATFKQDTDELTDQCFEYDYRCSRIERILKQAQKEERERVYSFLKANYRPIKDAYKFFSALSPSGIICSVGTNLFSYIVFNCPGLVDHKTIKLSDVDLEFIATKAAGAHFKTKTNPDRQLIRYQFMEIFVRLALDKYLKTGICRTYDEAIIKMFSENVIPYLKRFDSQEFRLTKLYRESCDKVLRKHMQILKDIYRKAASVDANPGEDYFMSMNEFVNLVALSGVVDDGFSTREIGTIFNLSMMSQVDEIHSDRHCQMTFLEFVEAVCRVADRVIVAPGQVNTSATVNTNLLNLGENKISRRQMNQQPSMANSSNGLTNFLLNNNPEINLQQQSEYAPGDTFYSMGGLGNNNNLINTAKDSDFDKQFIDKALKLDMNYLPSSEMTLEAKVYEYILKIIQNLFGEQFTKQFIVKNQAKQLGGGVAASQESGGALLTSIKSAKQSNGGSTTMLSAVGAGDPTASTRSIEKIMKEKFTATQRSQISGQTQISNLGI